MMALARQAPAFAHGTAAPSHRARLALFWIVAAGILYNNLFRWYPFPAGRSANDLESLASNLPGIVVNIAIYCALLAGVLLSGATTLLVRRSRLLQVYCLYLVLQAPFRSDALAECIRSFAMAVMLLSADWLAAIVFGAPRYAAQFLRRMWCVMVATILVGLLIGLLLKDAVNWGNGLSQSFENQNRAEFFFFYVLPQFAFALSFAVLLGTYRRPGVLFLTALMAISLITLLAGRTMTRTITFSIALIVLVFLFRFARRTLVVVGIVVAISAAAFPGEALQVASKLRVADFFASEPSVDPTNGRLFLVLTNLQSFADSPVFGQGAVEARRRVEASGSRARTEHGYSIHLASSGLFALFLLAFVLQGVMAAFEILLKRRGLPQDPFDPYAVAIGALALASFVTGFFWTFSSATNFYDWVAVFFVSAARVLRELYREAAWHPRESSA
jgi:hypothetical protein